MNKKLLTLAVAAAMVAPTAAMADAVLYGKLHMSVDWADVEGGALVFDGASLTPRNINPGVDADGKLNSFEGWGMSGGGMLPGELRANRIGVKGSEDLGNGIKAVYQVEFGVKLSEEKKDATGNAASGADDAVTMRNTYIGVAGGFGTAVVGRNDTPLKTSTGKLDLFADTMADNNGTVGFNDVRADNAIAYISPSLSGFQFLGAITAGGGSTAGAGANVNADSLGEVYSLAGIYSNGPFYASLAYEAITNEMYMNTATSLNEYSSAYVDNDFTKWRAGLGLMDWNGFTMTGIYEYQDLDYAYLDGERDLWQIQAGYAFGNNMVKAMYGASSLDVGDQSIDRDAWSIAFDHNFSKRTKVYALYTQVTDDNVALSNVGVWTGSDWSGFSVGMVHSF